jgi:capsular polysaccharide biosynthesis protein
MSDKPLYYGGGKPMYYGGGKPMYYGGGKPMYYGGSGGMRYGGGSYGAYGSYGGYGGTDDGSVVGTISVSRILRVLSQRWLSVFVFLLVGLIAAFVVYRISPTIYESKSEFSMDIRRSVGNRSVGAIDQSLPDLGNTYAEIFNTRISDWRSDKVLLMIEQQYRTSHPSSTVSQEDIFSTIAGSQIELVRNSRIITIAVRSEEAKLAQALANAYAESIESFTVEEKKVRCDKAVSQIHENVEKKRREADKIAKSLFIVFIGISNLHLDCRGLHFRRVGIKNKVALIKYRKIIADILELAKRVRGDDNRRAARFCLLLEKLLDKSALERIESIKGLVKEYVWVLFRQSECGCRLTAHTL